MESFTIASRPIYENETWQQLFDEDEIKYKKIFKTKGKLTSAIQTFQGANLIYLPDNNPNIKSFGIWQNGKEFYVENPQYISELSNNGKLLYFPPKVEENYEEYIDFNDYGDSRR